MQRSLVALNRYAALLEALKSDQFFFHRLLSYQFDLVQQQIQTQARPNRPRPDMASTLHAFETLMN